MDDTRLEHRLNAMAETRIRPELYASLYAHDADLARLFKLWPLLKKQDHQALVDRVEHLVSAGSVGTRTGDE